jgi:hypothetical protein
MAEAAGAGGRGRPAVNAALALGLLAMGALQIALPVPGWPALLLLLALVLCNRRSLSRTAMVIGTLVLLALAALLPLGGLAASGALARALFLAALLLALNLLSLAAARSGDVQQAAAVVASRPRGSRYAYVSLGTHLFSIFLNFGAISVMATLLAQSRARLLRENALEDLTLAMLRGFAAMPMWSPLALSTLITLSIMPEVGYFEVLPYGLAAALLYMLAGYRLARGAAPRGAPAAAVAPPGPGERAVLARVALRIAALVLLAVGLYRLAALSLPDAVLLAVLGFSLVWGLTQRHAGRAPPLWRDAGGAASGSVNEIVIVSGAGALGAVISYAMAGAPGGLAPPPPALVPLMVGLAPALMVLGGLVAINPIVSASVILGVLLPLVPPAALMWLAVSVKTGWGITSAASPFTANMLIACRLMGVDGGDMARRANRRLTLLALAVTGLFCASATALSL